MPRVRQRSSARVADVVATPLIEDEEGAARTARELADARLDAVVFAPTMAAPPSYAARALADVEAPLVIWNAPSVRRLPDDLHQDEATVHSTSVGAVMYGNVLVREGRRVAVVTAGHDDPAAIDRLLRTVRAVAAAGSIRGSTVLRLGDPIPGYLDVESSAAELAWLGVTEHAIALADWEARVGAITDVDAATALAALRSDGDWSGDGGPGALRSSAVAVALERTMTEAGAVAGTVNCHGPWFRTSGAVGIPACLAVVREASAGRPVSCTGDQPTALALLLARRVAGAALYCECYTPESETGLVLVAAGGEGDPAWADPDEPRVLEAQRPLPRCMRRGDERGLRPSPRTGDPAVAFADRWRLDAGLGHRRDRGEPLPRPARSEWHVPLRFGPADMALERWIGSGATHHNALAPGRLDVEVPALAAALAIEHVRV